MVSVIPVNTGIQESTFTNTSFFSESFQNMQKQNTQQQTQWKTLFIVLGSSIILGLGYLVSVILRNEESNTPNTSVIPVNTGIQSQSPSVSVIARNEAIQPSSASGTKDLPPCNLINPFSGATDCKKEEKPKLKFQKPNTEWKTRTLSGITYVFGEGNPREVALSQSQIQTFRKSVSNKNDYGDYGYVTPSIEKSLRKFLEDQNWKYFVYCFSQENNQTNTIPWEQRKNKSSLYIQDLVQVGFLDIESFLLIDSSTQRKELNTEKAIPLKWFLLQMVSPSEIPEGESELYSCTKKYGESLLEQISKIHKDYWGINDFQ